MAKKTRSPRTMKFLVLRQEAFKVGPVTMGTAVVNHKAITIDAELVAELRVGVTKWAKDTVAGQQAYAYAGDDMNIGDLSNYDLAPIRREGETIVVHLPMPNSWTLHWSQAASGSSASPPPCPSCWTSPEAGAKDRSSKAACASTRWSSPRSTTAC